MTEVIVRQNESFEKVLRRFKRKCQSAGIVSEMRKREHFDTPSVRRKKKDIFAARKLRKRLAEGNY
jgi:small subunit ribosomal protein S21